jgi:hypothetical protein
MGLYAEGLEFEGGGTYIWNLLSVSEYGGIIHTRAYIWGGGGSYSEVW